MEYAEALEEKENAQSKCELEASVDGQTVLANTTDYAASAVATGTNKEMSKIKAMMKQLAASVTDQAETVATLYTKMNIVSSSSNKTIENKQAQPSLHMCAHCKRKVYHKERNCLKFEVNKANSYPGWKRFFTKG